MNGDPHQYFMMSSFREYMRAAAAEAEATKSLMVSKVSRTQATMKIHEACR
jgi:hypothetical protein